MRHCLPEGMLHSLARYGRRLAWLACALAAPAVADEGLFTFAGFGTLGATRTTSNEVNFVRDLSQAAGAREKWDGRVDSLLGAQATLKLAPNLHGTVQAVSSHGYDQSFRPRLSWAYLKYEPTAQLALRAGRVGTEFFMLSDSRQVGYSYLTVRPPGDYFWHLPFSSIDGADAVVKMPLGEAILQGKLYYGISDERLALADRVWKLDGSSMVGGYLEYQDGPWSARLGYANIKFRNNLPLEPVLRNFPPIAKQSADYLATQGERSHYYSFGLVYDQGPWQAQLMLNHIEQGSKAFQSSDGGYVLAGYRVGPVTPYIGYSWVYSDQRRNTLNSVVAAIMADSHVHQNTTMLGARWDVARNVALKAQWDHIDGEAASIFPYRRETPAWDGKLDVFSLTLDFIF